MKATHAVTFCILSLFPLVQYASGEKSPPITPTPQVKQDNQKINLNKVDLSKLQQSFKGIGIKRAQAIIDYREAHGQFKSVNELAQVKGIGEKFVAKNKEQLGKTYTAE